MATEIEISRARESVRSTIRNLTHSVDTSDCTPVQARFMFLGAALQAVGCPSEFGSAMERRMAARELRDQLQELLTFLHVAVFPRCEKCADTEAALKWQGNKQYCSGCINMMRVQKMEEELATARAVRTIEGVPFGI